MCPSCVLVLHEEEEDDDVEGPRHVLSKAVILSFDVRPSMCPLAGECYGTESVPYSTLTKWLWAPLGPTFHFTVQRVAVSKVQRL